MEIYNPATNTWITAAPMAYERSSFEMAALDGKIYAVGGCSEGYHRCLSSVEAYDPQTNTWSTVAGMGTARMYFGLAVMRGKLYAVGGVSDGTSISISSPIQYSPFPPVSIATAEAYDPQHDRWEAVTPMASARCMHALVAI